MISEPVTRPDGIVIEMFVYHPSHTLVVSFAGFGSGYSVEEILALGDSNYHKGINLIREHTYRASSFDLQSFGERLLNKEIDTLLESKDNIQKHS